MYARLQGPMVITRTIRPPRIAYLVGTLSQCDILIQVCSLTWGGRHFCIVPYDPSVGLSGEWWRLLAAYDPDYIIPCVELDETTEERLADMTARRYPGTTNLGRRDISVWNPKPDAEAIRGQSLYSALAAIGAYDKREDFSPVLVPDVPSGHPLELYIKARYGCLNESWASSILSSGGLEYTLTLDSFVPVEHVGLSDNFLDFLMHD